MDLTAPDAGDKLAALLRLEDSVVAVSAKAPCRNAEDFLVNAKIIASLVKAFTTQPVAHVVNISSDAVYADEPLPLSETVPAAPGSLHGAMHVAREIALKGLGATARHPAPDADLRRCRSAQRLWPEPVPPQGE